MLLSVRGPGRRQGEDKKVLANNSLRPAAKQKMIFYSIKKLEKRKVKDKESL
ncbi:hypothetical protein CLOLEP_02504 [[Clostridium] leptum DSM 753]|uniref:Uncharacterized protein n=1 Tax=[Clostridium] leptum DSM 753 TaxID=428125 RepID=A7VV92_9FIRM|nr:hypothetical protein CLOLEP_02504 [[Clostridium] leptum DSM 753]